MPYFEVDARELQRPGWTYTIDTLATFPEADDVVLILGADAAVGLPSWHRADELIGSVRLAIVPRPGAAPSEVDAVLAGADVRWLDMPEMAISSTDLRRRAAVGMSVRFLVPHSVDEYIAQHGLYRED